MDEESQDPDSMDLYLKEIRDTPLLSASEEATLAAAIQNGDDTARSTLIRSNLRLVVSIAKGLTGRGLSLDDLVGEGNLGLIRATKDYDPAVARFSTYATQWIRQAMLYAITNTTAAIRLPSHVLDLLSKYRRAEANMESKGQSPTFDEVASAIGLTDIQKTLVKQAQTTRSIESDADTSRWVAEEPDLDAALDLDIYRRQLGYRMTRLDSRERNIVQSRFGIHGKEETLKAIGDRIGCTREWVRWLEIRAMALLKGEEPPIRRRHIATRSSRQSEMTSSV